MKIVVGKGYRIVKPKGEGGVPAWVPEMDYLDGVFFKVKSGDISRYWVVHKDRWLLNPNWLVPVNEFKGN